VEAALHLFLASFGGLHLDTVYFDAQGCMQIGKALADGAPAAECLAAVGQQAACLPGGGVFEVGTG
jgi:hypothetical protein